MRSDRAYRKALPLKTALQELREGVGIQFDPWMVKKFLEMMQEQSANGMYQ